MTVCNCSSYSYQFCSPSGVGYTSTIRFNQTRIAGTGVVDTCPNNLTAFLDMAATICISPGLPVSSLECETRFGLVEKGGTSLKAGLLGQLVV